MLHVQERRRHERVALVCPVVLKDKSGRVIFKGRSADISPSGIKAVSYTHLTLPTSDLV